MPHRSYLDTDTQSEFPRTVIQEFSSRLRDAEWSSAHVRFLTGAAHHFFAWLHENDLGLEAVDDTVVRDFVNHACRCQPLAADLPCQDFIWHVSSKRWWRLTVLRFVHFLEQTGRVPTPDDLDQNIRLLGTFLDHLQGQGYASISLTHYRSACAHFLVWLHRCRMPLAAIDATHAGPF